MARIALVGPGAIGGIVAAWLSQNSEHEVVICSRRPLEELTVETPTGTIHARARFVSDPARAPAVDWVLVATKAYDAAGAAAWFPRLVAGGAPVAIIQNGVEHRERFEPFLPRDRIIPVIVDCPAERTSPTRIRQRGTFTLSVADTGNGPGVARLFAATPFTVVVTSDFTTVAWKKLCLNSAGIVSALLLQPAGVFHDERIAEISKEIVRECVAVGRAEGAALEDTMMDWVVDTYRSHPRDSLNSMHADRMAGRQMEIDARNGAIVRLGKKHGIATPYNHMAMVLLRAMAEMRP